MVDDDLTALSSGKAVDYVWFLCLSEDIDQLVTEIHDIRELIAPPAQRGSDPYTQFVSRLKRRVATIHDQNIRRFFVSSLRHLDVCISFMGHVTQQFNIVRKSTSFWRTSLPLDKLIA